MIIATAAKLLGEVLIGRSPPKVLVYRTRERLNRWLGSGDRRFLFESLYSERGDVWEYATSRTQRERYARTVDCILTHRSGAGSLLEIGCSIGVCTGLLARRFAKVTAMDISREGLALAKQNNRDANNIEFVADDIRSWEVRQRFDVILASDVLYYLRASDSERLCDQLDRALADEGLLVTVTGIAWGAADPNEYFDDWDGVLGSRFQQIYEADIMDEERPYRIVAFRRYPISGRVGPSRAAGQ